MAKRRQFWVDVGGTFTDCVECNERGEMRTCKVLSNGVVKGQIDRVVEGGFVANQRIGEPDGFYVGWEIAVLDGAGAIESKGRVIGFLGKAGRFEIDGIPEGITREGCRYELSSEDEAPIVGIRMLMGLAADEPIGKVDVRLGTTRGTNALLERKGARTVYVTTEGFGDLLEIGTQAREKLFDIRVRKAKPLYDCVIELAERIDAQGKIVKMLSADEIRQPLQSAFDAGIRSVGICFVNAYLNDSHERIAAAIARDIGFNQVSVSTELTPTIHMLNRGDTASLDAYLSPVIKDYIQSIMAKAPEARLHLMTSAGALVDAGAFSGKDSLLSGPAGGVVGFAHTAEAAGYQKAIGFDMGGTSTDVSRYDGHYEYQYAGEKAGVRVVAPMYAIETVAAGGGSICRFDGQRFLVGPESAGANPGPACYGRGGPLTVTDVNLLNGKIDAEQFPFPLDVKAVETAIDVIAMQIIAATGERMTRTDIAKGFTQVANQKMAGAIAKVSAAKGYDPSEYAMVAFGGAAAQHACAVARLLNIKKILVPSLASVLSAYGIGMADITRFGEQGLLRVFHDETRADIEKIFERLSAELREEVQTTGLQAEAIGKASRLLDMRYTGEQTPITVREPEDADWVRAFSELHKQLYGHTHEDREVEVCTVRVEVTGETDKPNVFEENRVDHRDFKSDVTREIQLECGVRQASVYQREALKSGDRIDGPAMILEKLSTIIVDPGYEAEVNAHGDIELTCVKENEEKNESVSNASETKDLVPILADPIRLELFNNHFTQIAAQMGVTLQKTAISVNVKERLDFSCAILDGDGNLVVNAPHIPVHLGAMSETVRCLNNAIRDMQPGDVYLTNDPDEGGSHLPDLTVVTPVFDEAEKEIRFFTASRAHHAEIGGLRPGSAFPFAKNLAEEGVVIRRMRISRGGIFDEGKIREKLGNGPYPSRAVDENVADIRAAVAANRVGQIELEKLIAQSGWGMVEAYMGFIRDAAAWKTREMIRKIADGRYEFEDELDDGATFKVAIDVESEGLRINFTGTGKVNTNSLNANEAIVRAAVLYCLRCMIDEEIPLNEGVMEPVEIVLPECMLNPPKSGDAHKHVAVVGGNVELSQRVVDLIFGALGVAAGSQGTMNNLVFGNERFGYYETICGGVGACEGYDGASAVHTHMTNTRMTDVEIMEREFPARVERFAIRQGSGGNGQWRGGDGVERWIRFLEDVEVSLLTQRRVVAPPGLSGGDDGGIGRNLLFRKSGVEVDVGGCAEFGADAGDLLRISTPGGGGCGVKNND